MVLFFLPKYFLQPPTTSYFITKAPFPSISHFKNPLFSHPHISHLNTQIYFLNCSFYLIKRLSTLPYSLLPIHYYLVKRLSTLPYSLLPIRYYLVKRLSTLPYSLLPIRYYLIKRLSALAVTFNFLTLNFKLSTNLPQNKKIHTFTP